MVQEAENWKADDDANKVRIKAKNGFGNYFCSLKKTLPGKKLKDKFEAGDKEKIEQAVADALEWLEKNQLAEKDEFEAKQKDVEQVVNPIMMKVYQAAGAGAGGGGMPDVGDMGGAPFPAGAGPSVEEVD